MIRALIQIVNALRTRVRARLERLAGVRVANDGCEVVQNEQKNGWALAPAMVHGFSRQERHAVSDLRLQAERRHYGTLLALLLAVAVTNSWPQAAPKGDLGQAPNKKPSILEKVGIDQNLNAQVPLDLTFLDERGQPVQLRQYFGEKPVIITMVYYTCPMLCSQVLSGLTAALNGMPGFNVGREFNVVTVSFDPKDTPQAAMENKERYLKRYRREGSDQGWHCLVGKKDQIDALAQALGFRYAWDQENQQYAHASGIMLLTPDGHIAQYRFGIEYAPHELRLGLVEASKGKIGTFVDRMLVFYCYHYDPRQGKYGLAIFNILRLSALATVLVLGGFLLIMFRRERASRESRWSRAS